MRRECRAGDQPGEVPTQKADDDERGDQTEDRHQVRGDEAIADQKELPPQADKLQAEEGDEELEGR